MSRRDEVLPANTIDLLKMLDELVPPRCIRRGETIEEAQRYAGRRELVEELIHRWEEENEG